MWGPEQKVGLFVFATLVLLGIGTFIVGDLDLWGEKRESYTATFSDIKGLKEQAPVRMAGVEVGKVGSIRLEDGRAEVVLHLKPDVKLPRSTTAMVEGTGLVGEKYVTLSYESGDPTRLKPGGHIPQARGAKDMDDLMQSFGRVGDNLAELTDTLKAGLGGEKGERRMRRIVTNLDATLGEVRAMVAENRRVIRETLENANTVSAELRDTLRENRATLRKTLERVADASDNLARITGDIREGKGTLGRLYREDGLYQKVESISANLESLTQQISSGEGTIGKLAYDEELGEKLDSAITSLGEMTGRIYKLKTTVGMDTRYLTRHEESRTDFQIRLQSKPERYYVAGVTSDGLATRANEATDPNDRFFGQDFGDELKFTFLFGREWPAYNLSGRIGLLESTGGAGLSYYPWRSMELSADLWDFGGSNSGDFSGPQARLMARYSFFDDHLSVQAGMHNALSEDYRSPFAGVGLRFYDEDFKYLIGGMPVGGM
jgi:phospholipid/cholesterol/gamma-HCH transport system substrate-binding protein